jgi:hypothetical protein
MNAIAMQLRNRFPQQAGDDGPASDKPPVLGFQGVHPPVFFGIHSAVGL